MVILCVQVSKQINVTSAGMHAAKLHAGKLLIALVTLITCKLHVPNIAIYFPYIFDVPFPGHTNMLLVTRQSA